MCIALAFSGCTSSPPDGDSPKAAGPISALAGTNATFALDWPDEDTSRTVHIEYIPANITHSPQLGPRTAVIAKQSAGGDHEFVVLADGSVLRREACAAAEEPNQTCSESYTDVLWFEGSSWGYGLGMAHGVPVEEGYTSVRTLRKAGDAWELTLAVSTSDAEETYWIETSAPPAFPGFSFPELSPLGRFEFSAETGNLLQAYIKLNRSDRLEDMLHVQSVDYTSSGEGSDADPGATWEPAAPMEAWTEPVPAALRTPVPRFESALIEYYQHAHDTVADFRDFVAAQERPYLCGLDWYHGSTSTTGDVTISETYSTTKRIIAELTVCGDADEAYFVQVVMTWRQATVGGQTSEPNRSFEVEEDRTTPRPPLPEGYAPPAELSNASRLLAFYDEWFRTYGAVPDNIRLEPSVGGLSWLFFATQPGETGGGLRLSYLAGLYVSDGHPWQVTASPAQARSVTDP